MMHHVLATLVSEWVYWTSLRSTLLFLLLVLQIPGAPNSQMSFQKNTEAAQRVCIPKPWRHSISRVTGVIESLSWAGWARSVQYWACGWMCTIALGGFCVTCGDGAAEGSWGWQGMCNRHLSYIISCWGKLSVRRWWWEWCEAPENILLFFICTT